MEDNWMYFVIAFTKQGECIHLGAYKLLDNAKTRCYLEAMDWRRESLQFIFVQSFPAYFDINIGEWKPTEEGYSQMCEYDTDFILYVEEEKKND